MAKRDRSRRYVLKTLIYLFLFLVIMSIAFSYKVEFNDTYEMYGEDVFDELGWITPYKMQYSLELEGIDVIPHITIFRRTGGYRLATYCRTWDEDDCVNLDGIDLYDCEGGGPARWYGDMGDITSFTNAEGHYFDSSQDTVFNNDYPDSTGIYADVYYIDGFGTCVHDDEHTVTTYYTFNQSFYNCTTDGSGMNIYGGYCEGFECGIYPTHNISIGSDVCEIGKACDPTYENIPQHLASKNFSNSYCTDCGVAEEFVNVCTDVKNYRTYKRYTNAGCGSINWFVNSTKTNCSAQTFCDMSDYTVEINKSSLVSLCFGSKTSTDVSLSEDWGIPDYNVESTKTDNIVFNGTNLNFSIDGYTAPFPEDVTCFTDQSNKWKSIYAQINGEMVRAYQTTNYTMTSDGMIEVISTDLDAQTVNFNLYSNTTNAWCTGYTLSRYDTSELVSTKTITKTLGCGGDNFEINLWDVDYYPLDYDCFGGSALMSECLIASSNYTVGDPQYALAHLNSTSPSSIYTTTDAWEKFNINLTIKYNRQHNLTVKYYTHCEDTGTYGMYDEPQTLINKYSRMTVIHGTNIPSYTKIKIEKQNVTV